MGAAAICPILAAQCTELTPCAGHFCLQRSVLCKRLFSMTGLLVGNLTRYCRWLPECYEIAVSWL